MRPIAKRLVSACLVAVALVAGVRPADALAQATAKTVVVLTFDDTTADHATAAGMLNRRGLQGTFYVNSSRLGKRGYLTVEDLRFMAKSGHEIGGHTLGHVHLRRETEAERRRQICDDRQALLSLGFKVRSFAYPFGEFDESIKQLAMRCGYTTARGVTGLHRPDACRSCPYTEKIPPADLAAVRATSQNGIPRTARNLADFVTRAQRNGGGLVIFVFHRINDDRRNAYATSPRELSRFLDWVAGQRKAKRVVVKPLGDVVGGRVWPVPDDM
ncbi:polysaccharide deacetylase family protein [Sphaerimonospora cavernae]|uniref:Polysaccharide deacetylase family protein n=1 Tax=Sphaerimonospora cavernae TaxID=1740611 RepID=A0ABV6U3J0_9ACTN